MRKDLQIYKYAMFLICLLGLQVSAFGQDLGSSSGLFNAPNPKTKNTAKPAAKKAAPKPKTTAASQRPAPKPKTPIVTAKNLNRSKAKTAKSRRSAQIAKQTPVVETPTKVVVKQIEDADGIFEQAIDEGNAARDEREYERAEIAYLRAQSLKAKDSRAIYGLGNLYSDQQRWEEAERAYRTAIELEPESPDAYVALSFILTQPIVGMDLGDRYAEAEKMARRAIVLDATNAVAYDQLGVSLELRGIISDETRNAYQKAIELDSTFALAYAHLGRLLRRKGLNNESAAAYRNSIQMSVDVPTMILVAEVMQSQQRYMESEQLLRRALKQDPKNPTALFLLGRALTTRSSFEEAEQVLKKSAQISPNSFVSYTLLGSLFIRREKFDDAEKYLMKALTVVSDNEKKRLAQEFEMVGDGFYRVGKKKDAARVYRQAVALDKEKLALSEKLNKAESN